MNLMFGQSHLCTENNLVICEKEGGVKTFLTDCLGGCCLIRLRGSVVGQKIKGVSERDGTQRRSIFWACLMEWFLNILGLSSQTDKTNLF